MLIEAIVKKKQMEKYLTALGWRKYGEGHKHEKWTNGKIKTTLPRHREINEITAKTILKLAKTNQNEKG